MFCSTDILNQIFFGLHIINNVLEISYVFSIFSMYFHIDIRAYMITLQTFVAHIYLTHRHTRTYALTHVQSALTYPSISPSNPTFLLLPPPQLVWEPVPGAHAPLEQPLAGGRHEPLYVPSLHDHLRRPPARESGLLHHSPLHQNKTSIFLCCSLTHTFTHCLSNLSHSHCLSTYRWCTDASVAPNY